MEKKAILGTNRIIFTYSSSHLSGSDKVRFFYALKGRDGKAGLVDNNLVFSPTKGVLILDVSEKQRVESFFTFWKCAYSPILFSDIKGKSLIKYDTSHLSGSYKVRFFYAFKGRDNRDGILKRTESEQIAKGLLAVPKEKLAEISEFFAFWKCRTEVIDYNA